MYSWLCLWDTRLTMELGTEAARAWTGWAGGDLPPTRADRAGPPLAAANHRLPCRVLWARPCAQLSPALSPEAGRLPTTRGTTEALIAGKASEEAQCRLTLSAASSK